MREVDFLPSWYVRMRRRRRLLILQVWATLALAAGIIAWSLLIARNTRVAAQTLNALRDQVAQTNAQLAQMERLEGLRRQWRQKAEALSRMGLHVEASRVLGRIAEVMPRELALTSFSMDIEETARQTTGAARVAMKEQAAAPVDRRLRVTLAGAAPTDVELATFLTELNKIPFLEHVAPTYARDRREGGHLLREFEVTFTINLNCPEG